MDDKNEKKTDFENAQYNKKLLMGKLFNLLNDVKKSEAMDYPDMIGCIFLVVFEFLYKDMDFIKYLETMEENIERGVYV